MKKSLSLMALSMSTALVADNCCEPCKPCCVPQPRAPICCECYVPSYYDMQCDWGIYIDAEFLYWYGRESNLSFASQVTTTPVSTGTLPATATVPTKYNHFATKWAPGVRLGLGWNMDDGWDLFLGWTYYQNNKKNSVSGDVFTTEFPGLNQVGVVNPWLDNSITVLTDMIFQSVSAHWNMRFNQIDLVMGRRYYLSECFTMRPFAGLRGAWTNTQFRVNGFADQAITITSAPLGLVPGDYKMSTSDRFRNRNWGVGLIAGFQPTFFFTDEFSLYAGGDIALLWGEFKNKRSRNYSSLLNNTTTQINAAYSTSDNFFGMHPVLDLELGLRWETNWCENRYAFALDAGWEHHIWFDENTRIKVGDPIVRSTAQAGNTGRTNAKYYEEVTNLVMGGFVLRARLDF